MYTSRPSVLLEEHDPISAYWHSSAISPIQNAIHEGDLATVHRLINEERACLNQPLRGLSPLCLAISYGYLDIANYLISDRADLTLVDAGGSSALHYAAEMGFPTVCYQLIQLYDSRLLRNKAGKKFTDCNAFVASFFDRPARTEIIKIIVSTQNQAAWDLFRETYLNPDHKFAAWQLLYRTKEYSLLHLAAEMGNFFLFKQLLDLDSPHFSLSTLDKLGRTPLHVAVQAGRLQLIFSLLGTTGKIKTLSEIKTHKILKKKIRKAMEVLDKRGWSALHYAVNKKNERLCKILLKAYGDPEILHMGTNKQETPFALSLQPGYKKIYDLFEINIKEGNISLGEDKIRFFQKNDGIRIRAQLSPPPPPKSALKITSWICPIHPPAKIGDAPHCTCALQNTEQLMEQVDISQQIIRRTLKKLKVDRSYSVPAPPSSPNAPLTLETEEKEEEYSILFSPRGKEYHPNALSPTPSSPALAGSLPPAGQYDLSHHFSTPTGSPISACPKHGAAAACNCPRS
jgi:ankyrin repeat protein